MFDQGSTTGKVGRDAAQVLLGRDDLEPHDRFQQYGAGFLDGLAQGVRGGESESQVVGVASWAAPLTKVTFKSTRG